MSENPSKSDVTSEIKAKQSAVKALSIAVQIISHQTYHPEYFSTVSGVLKFLGSLRDQTEASIPKSPKKSRKKKAE